MIRIVEVGPRDGLQNEKMQVPTEAKVAFVNALARTGVSEVEVSAFVSPKWVPQLADSVEVFKLIERQPGVLYSALVPNEQGLDLALEVELDKIAVFTGATESFVKKNINTDIAGSFERFTPVVKRAKANGKIVRGYVSTAFWCPFEGKVDPRQSVDVAKRLLDLGADEVSIGDTIGKALVEDVESLLELLLKEVPAHLVNLHLHDTYGFAGQNIVTAYRMGVHSFDSSANGLGGCPYAPGAPGNVSTERTARALMQEGAELNIDIIAVRDAGRAVRKYLGDKK
ncbi:hydroxymethylglutaryl-CoA lyase [Myxococcota bacterium]|nr:hydroxymethylglutaryl-CoA lyase [Myxococcota bacterium]